MKGTKTTVNKDVVHLIKRIEEKRQHLYQTVLIKGLSAHETIKVSRQLDSLLSDYQRRGDMGIENEPCYKSPGENIIREVKCSNE